MIDPNNIVFAAQMQRQNHGQRMLTQLAVCRMIELEMEREERQTRTANAKYGAMKREFEAKHSRV